jgi:hypothetical protein
MRQSIGRPRYCSGALLTFNENRYASTFGGLQGSTSAPRATMTRNIKKQQTTNQKPAGVTEEEKERRCDRGGVRGKCARG